MRKQIIFLLLLLLGAGRAWAQGENNNWAFGFLQGITFATGVPVHLPTNMGSTSLNVPARGISGYSTISDAQGRLLFYTDGVIVWDSQHRPMTNACGTCDGAIAQLNVGYGAWRSVLIVKRPGSNSLYYIFTTDSQQNLFSGGLSYTEVDMSLRGGLGGVTAVRNVRLPTPTLTSKISEGVAGIQHTNRKDVWVVVHGLTDGAFYSLLVTAAGISPTPVASTSGSYSNRFSVMKFSPDGKRLARCGFLGNPVELFDFDGATGLLTNQQILEPASNLVVHDIEFSPDATKLFQIQSVYTTAPAKPQGALYQYDLLAGSPAAVRSSKLLVTMSPAVDQYAWSSMETGPDGRIYLPINPEMSIIDWPNRRGPATGFRYVGMPKFGDATHIGVNTWELQNIVRPQPPSLDYMAETTCAGGTVTFTPYEVPTGTGPLTWTFSDPLTGKVDSVQGLNVTRTYPAAGVYSVTLSTTSRGQYYRFRRSVVVSPLPTVALPDTVRLCQDGASALVGVPAPTGTTVRWSDGSTTPQLEIAKAGTYTVEVRNYQGCVKTGTTVAVVCRVPNIITPNGDAANETFRLEGMQARQWGLEIYSRWGRLVHQQASYDNTWNATQQPPGTYYYRLYNSQTGQQLRGWLEVVR